MTDEELRSLIASNASSIAEMRADAADFKRSIDEGWQQTQAGLEELRKRCDSNARSVEANSEAIAQLGTKIGQVDDAVVDFFERLDGQLADMTERMSQLIDLALQNAKEHSDFMARIRVNDERFSTLLEEARADRDEFRRRFERLSGGMGEGL